MTDNASRIRIKLPRSEFSIDIDLELPARGITALYGPSGSGKTSVLRGVAGLERPRPGLVCIDGETWQDDEGGVFLAPWQRAVGYVFQEASLFEHLDVRGNLEYGRRRAGDAANAISVDDTIDLLGIRHLLDRRTQDLSGGERQRVAIARAVACAPRLLLLDEPLASLDVARRQEVLPWLARLRDELRLPMLYVTHAIDEVARLADSLVVLEKGRAVATGPTRDVLSRIDSAGHFGDDAGALLEGTVTERDETWKLSRVAFPGGSLWLRDMGLALGQGVRLRVLARDVSVATQEPRGVSIQNVLPCTLKAIAPDVQPSQVMVQAACGESLLLARVTARAAHDLALAPGQDAWLQVKSVALVG